MDNHYTKMNQAGTVVDQQVIIAKDFLAKI